MIKTKKTKRVLQEKGWLKRKKKLEFVMKMEKEKEKAPIREGFERSKPKKGFFFFE